MMPNLGQGGCMAIEDAFVLGRELRRVGHDRAQAPPRWCTVPLQWYRCHCAACGGLGAVVAGGRVYPSLPPSHRADRVEG